MKQKFSVIVAIDNDYELTSNFIENLLNNTCFSNGELIIVVDGGNDYRTLNYLLEKSQKYSFIKVIHNKIKSGYSKANNLGYAKSNGDYLVFINSDVFPFPGSIVQLLNYLEDNPNCGAVQGLLIYPQTLLVQSTGHLFMNNGNTHVYSGSSPQNPFVQTVGKRQALTTAFTAMHAEVFSENGMFDEEYYNAYEGMELTLKITLKGRECIYYPGAMAYHITGGSRNFLNYNDKLSGILFWTRWKEKIIPDIADYLRPQITAYMQKEIYFLILCSDISGWCEILAELKMKTSGEIVIHSSGHNKSLNLYYELPYSALNYKGTYLFITDNIYDLAQNKNWAHVRNNKKDLIIDSHANIIPFYVLNGEQK